MAIQSNDTVHSYADSIVSASNSVSSATGTKDDGNVYQGQAGISANIDGDKNAGEQAKERAIDFIQVPSTMQSSRRQMLRLQDISIIIEARVAKNCIVQQSIEKGRDRWLK